MNHPKSTNGSDVATDWERAAVPAQTAPAAFHRDWLNSACETPALRALDFVAGFDNL
jgi:hypothetical protein